MLKKQGRIMLGIYTTPAVIQRYTKHRKTIGLSSSEFLRLLLETAERSPQFIELERTAAVATKLRRSLMKSQSRTRRE